MTNEVVLNLYFSVMHSDIFSKTQAAQKREVGQPVSESERYLWEEEEEEAVEEEEEEEEEDRNVMAASQPSTIT